MQISDNKEQAKLARCPSVAGIPLKKRPFLRTRSPSPPPQSELSPTSVCQAQPEACVAEPKVSTSNLGSQMPVSGTVAVMGSSFEGKDELSGDGTLSLQSLSVIHLQGSKPLDATASTGISNCRRSALNDNSASWPAMGKMELRSTPDESWQPEGIAEKIPSDKSAFRRVSGNNELTALKGPCGMVSEGQNRGFVDREKLNACHGDVSALKQLDNDQSGTSELETIVDPAQMCAKRSNWDLNTMMDTWDILLSDKAKNYAEGGDNGLDMGVRDVKLEIWPTQVSKEEPHRVHVTTKHVDNDNFLKFHKSPMFRTVQFSSDPDLNLQLNPDSGTWSHLSGGIGHPNPKVNTVGGSDLTLTIKPVSAVGGSKIPLINAIKPEPHEVYSHGLTSQVGNSNLNILQKTVKPEPCEFSQDGLSFSQNRSKFTHNFGVTLEPKEVASQMALKATEENVQHTEIDNCQLKGPVHAKVTQDSRESVSRVDCTVSQPLPTNSSKLGDLHVKMPTNADKGSGEHMESRFNVFDGEELDRGSVTAVDMGAKTAENVVESTNMKKDESSEATIAVGTCLGASQDASEVNAGASGVLYEPVSCDGKGEIVALVSDGSARMSYLGGLTPEISGLASEHNIASREKMAACKSDVMGKPDVSDEIPGGKPCNNDNLDNSHDAVGQVQTILKEHPDDDIEDGEVRDLRHGTVAEVLCNEGETKHSVNEDAADVVPMDGLVATVSHVGKTENEIQDTVETMKHNFTKCADNKCGDEMGLYAAKDVQPSDVPTSEARAKKSIKVIRRISGDHLVKHKGLEIKSFSNKTSSGNNSPVPRDSQGEVGSHKVKAACSNPLPAKHLIPLKSKTSPNPDYTKTISSKISSSNVHSIPASKDPFSGRAKFVPHKPMMSHIEKECSSDKSFRTDQPHRRGTGESPRELREFEKERKIELTRKPGYDFDHAHGRLDNQLETVSGDRNADPVCRSERFNRSTSFRYTRPKNPCETSFAVGMDGSVESADRAARMLGNDRSQNFCHLPSRRWSPGREEGPILVDAQVVRTMREISPGRCSDGDVADLVFLSHEEKLMRDLANDTNDPSVLSYERGENSFTRRGRRSISPVQRRRFSRMCLPSSMRPRLHSPRPLSPRRSPDGFDLHPELIQCRSPQTLRGERVRPTRQRFPDDMPDRRRGSPSYLPRLHDGMRDLGPQREYDCPRPSRGLPRNMRRFGLIDSCINAEEEYFGPLHSEQLNELVGGDVVDEGRSYNGRRGPMHCLNQRYNARAAAEEDNFHFRVERGPSRPMRFRTEGEEEFADRGNLRDRCIRNRLGDLPHRLRGMEEQEDNYVLDGMPGWHNSGFDGSRLKRRRF